MYFLQPSFTKASFFAYLRKEFKNENLKEGEKYTEGKTYHRGEDLLSFRKLGENGYLFSFVVLPLKLLDF